MLTLTHSYIDMDAEDVLEPAQEIIQELMQLEGVDGYVTETFCRQSRFFQPKNGRVKVVWVHMAIL